MLPPSLGSRATVARMAPGAERERGFLPAPLGAPATLPNPESLQRHLGLAARSPRVQVPCGPEMDGRCPLVGLRIPQPLCDEAYLSRLRPEVRVPSALPTVAFSFWPTPTPIRRTRKRRAFSGRLHSARRTFRSERAIPWANRKLARAWRARRNQRVTRSPRRRRARERSELKRQRGYCLEENNAPEPCERRSPSTKTLEGPGREPLPNPDWSGRKWDQQAAATAHSSSPASWWSGRLGNSSLALPCACLLWEGFGEKRLK
uniref:Uncharacterized protein n=1 Tax=Rangifer tarandus platyrhynchus TaxID=3082113 RepID=A0ACB0FJ81_RANTA|nr:unnamed protein product [Rangifer tarandus platyrhynchus]